MVKAMGKKKIIHLLIDIIALIVLIVVDRITKNLAVINLKDKKPFVLWEDVFELYYLENRGAAFGMMQNKQALFFITGIIMLCIVAYVLIKMPFGYKYTLFEIALVLLGSGAIGNMIDRISQNYVVDFFYFVLINFPIFNVADIYVTISCIMLAIMILFVFKDEELKFLSFKNKAKDNAEI